MLAVALAIVAVAALFPAREARGALGAKGIWISQAELLRLPESGAAWTKLKATADGALGIADIADQDSDHDVKTLAVALVAARLDSQSYRDKAVGALRSVVGTETGARTLALGRNLVSYVVAADLVGYSDPDFVAWVRTIRDALISTHEGRANNWGTMAGASRAAADVYLGDSADLARTAQVFRGWLGDRSSYAGFDYGDLSWQADPGAPVGINPPGAVKQGHSIDGALPEEMRRGSGFEWPPAFDVHVWGGLAGAVAQAQVLSRQGYDAWSWQSQALRRAAQFLYDLDRAFGGWWASGDDRWQPWLLNAAYGTSFPTSSAGLGKNMAWTDWTFAKSAGGPVGGSVLPLPATDPPPVLPPPPAAPPSSAAALTFTPTEDAAVGSSRPTRNYGALTTLHVRPATYRSYVKFVVSGLSGAASSAKLRLFVTDPSADGGSVYPVSSGWTESAITWTNAPPIGGASLASAGAPSAGVWIEFDLGQSIVGNGTYSFAIASSRSNSVYYSSREDSNPPRLVVTQAR